VLYNRNIQFSRLIKVNGQLKEFNFRKPSPESSTYNVDIGDERGNRFIWSMEQSEGQWKIKGGLLPSWIVDSENLLDAAITEVESHPDNLIR
jgi:hypothetical protein